MNKIFIGIDVSKDVFDFCLIDQDHHIISSKNVLPNTVEGIEEFHLFLKKYSDFDKWACMEHTGHYGALLCYMFTKNGLMFSMVNPLEIKRSMGLTRGKSDAVDAYRIASYAVTNTHKLTPFKLPSKQLLKLKAIMGVRETFTKVNVQLKNSRKAILVLHKSLSMTLQIKEFDRLIKHNQQAIKKVEKHMMEIIQSDETLLISYTKISKVIGVGPITAIKCISETENFTKFSNGRQFSCHCGLAPFEYQSGSSVRGRTRTSKLCNKALKSILFKAAGSAIQHDPQLKAYYTRKVSQGKHKLSVLNAVANKIVLRIFAVANRNEPFVKLMA